MTGLKMNQITAIMNTIQTNVKHTDEQLRDYFMKAIKVPKDVADYYVGERAAIYERHQAYRKRIKV